MRYKIALLLLILAGIAVIIVAQFSIPTLFDADGYLHIRMAEFIREGGLRYNFHWARYSTFTDHFADKDLLYHLLLIPFSLWPNIFFGAKIAACLFAIFLYLAFFFCLKRYCIKPLVPILLAAFFLSAPFLVAISRPRPMIFSIALTLLFTHFLIKGKRWVLFALAVVYTLTHVSGPHLIFFAALGEVIRYCNQRQFAWKSVLAVAGGVLMGILIHPNFPNNLLVLYLNGVLVPIYALKWGLELGAEFFPTDTRDFVLGYPLVLIGLILLLAAATSPARRIKISTKIWMGISAFFFVFSFFSRRYGIHSYPMILISLGAYFSDWWSQERLLLFRQSKLVQWLVVSGTSVILTFVVLNTYKGFRQNALSEMICNSHFEAVAQYMSQNIPPQELIFHTNWSDSQYFIGLNPQNDYFVTLDPMYMYYWDPKKYQLYREIAFGNSSDPYKFLKEDFGVRYGYAGKNYFSGLITQLRNDARFEVMAEDGLGLIFRLK